MITEAPSSMNLCAVASPIPEAAPVITETFPSSRIDSPFRSIELLFYFSCFKPGKYRCEQ